MPVTTLTYPLVAILACILAGASFLGYSHDLSSQVVATIYGAVISGVTVGHFTSKSSTGA